MISSTQAFPGDPILFALSTVIVNLVDGTDAPRDGLRDTPKRMAAALREMTSGYAVDVEALFTTFERDGYDSLVVERGIPFTSLCEHHVLPFNGVAHIGYLPVERVVGLSKLARVVDAFARRLQIQERMTVQIADAIEKHLTPLGVIVVVEAEHSCMACRGVRKPGVVAVTSVTRGALRDNPESRAEALAMLRP